MNEKELDVFKCKLYYQGNIKDIKLFQDTWDKLIKGIKLKGD